MMTAPEKTKQTTLILSLFIIVLLGLNGVLLFTSWRGSQSIKRASTDLRNTMPLNRSSSDLQQETERQVESLQKTTDETYQIVSEQASQMADEFETSTSDLLDEMNLQFQKISTDAQATANTLLEALNQKLEQFKEQTRSTNP